VFESPDPQVRRFWKGKFATVDTQGYIAADAHAVLVCFRGTEPARPADIVTDLSYTVAVAAAYGAGSIHGGFLNAIDSVWDDIAAKIAEFGAGRQTVWFAGHSLGGALAVLAASRYEQLVTRQNARAKKEIAALEAQLEADPGNAELIGKRELAIATLRGRVGGVYTIGQPRVGDAVFTKELGQRFGDRHVRIINNRDVVPRVPLRAMDFDHSGTVLYFDEFGRLHRDPGLWLRLLDTVVISRAEVEKSREGVRDHSSSAYVDLLDKARKSTSALTRLAVS
jgi:pimeloyl-ACP methyl ester carboxylesterase